VCWVNVKKKIVLFTLLSVFLLFLTVLISSAQERIVGVAEGDWFKYGDFDVDWSSTDPNATFPPLGGEWVVEINETEWMLMSVQNIFSSRAIFFQTLKHFKDGTERTEGGYLDIDTGLGNLSSILSTPCMVISASLDVNDTVYTHHPFSAWKINETIIRAYPDSVRETNHLNMTSEHSWIVNETLYDFRNYYWDRSTGILVEYSFEEIKQTEEYQTTWSISYRITESNVWTVPEFPTWKSILLILIVILLILIVFTVTIIIYKRRLLKTKGRSESLSKNFQ